ncbi:MAG: transglutaminase domain-containing protein [Burkholderiales bacterium]|nr:transglutaminase domain-containing protein [Burkholderiales bacterium]
MQSLDRAQPPQPAMNGCSADGFIFSGSTFHNRYDKDYRGAADAQPPARWIQDTALLQHDHPKVRLLGMKLTQLKSGNRDKAVACFEYVRSLKFSCAVDAVHMPSVEVLAARMGDGFSKSTLFIALLRSVGIPARLRIVLLRPSYMRGISGGDGSVVEHAFTEVLVDREWLGVDTYVIDLQLNLRARTRLAEERRSAGYGVHTKGSVSWDGKSSSFGQFSSEDPGSLPILDLGAYDDVHQFHASAGPAALSEWASRKTWSFTSVMANRRLRKLRRPHEGESCQAVVPMVGAVVPARSAQR